MGVPLETEINKTLISRSGSRASQRQSDLDAFSLALIDRLEPAC